MLTPILGHDDRQPAQVGMVLSVAQKADGTLRLSMDRVATNSSTVPNIWTFNVFDSHFEIDEEYIRLVENEVNKPQDEKSGNGIGAPDSVLKKIGHALLTSLLCAAIEAKETGPI